MKNTWLELDLGTLRDNIAQMSAALSADTKIILVVKSDAYGHGMIPVARCAAEGGVTWFAVTQVAEAVRLRETFADAGIVIMGRIAPEDVSAVIEHRLTPVIVDKDHGQSLAAAAGAISQVVRCHVKIDTGMGRLGIPWESAPDIVAPLAGEKGLEITGICSHFSSSSNPDASYTKVQASRFSDVIAKCEEKGLTIPFKHVANSGALLRGSELEPWGAAGA